MRYDIPIRLYLQREYANFSVAITKKFFLTEFLFSGEKVENPHVTPCGPYERRIISGTIYLYLQRGYA